MSEQTFLLILSSLLVIIIAAMLGFLSAVLWQLVKVLREVGGIMKNIRMGSDTLSQDLASARQQILKVAGIAFEKFTTRRSRKKQNPADTTISDNE